MNNGWKIKPCPFCGGTPEWKSLSNKAGGKAYTVYWLVHQCVDEQGVAIEIKTALLPTKKEVAEIWSRREGEGR